MNINSLSLLTASLYVDIIDVTNTCLGPHLLLNSKERMNTYITSHYCYSLNTWYMHLYKNTSLDINMIYV